MVRARTGISFSFRPLLVAVVGVVVFGIVSVVFFSQPDYVFIFVFNSRGVPVRGSKFLRLGTGWCCRLVGLVWFGLVWMDGRFIPLSFHFHEQGWEVTDEGSLETLSV